MNYPESTIKKKKYNRLSVIFLTVFTMITFTLLFFPGQLKAVTLRELGNSIAKLSGEEEALLEEILASEAIVEMRKNEITSLNEDLAVLEDQMVMLNRQRDEISRSIEKKQGILAEKAVFSYKYGSNDIARFVITARDINEIVNNLYLFKNIMSREAEIIEELRYDREEFERINRKSIKKKEEVETTKSNIEEEKEKLEKDIAENRVLLDKVKGEKSEIQNLLSEIKARIARVQPPGLTLVGEWEMVATAYYAYGSGGNDINGNGITAIGLRARKGIVAVDPRIIPLGTRLFIPGYGEALAADTGGWIKNNRIDLCFESLQECYGYGRRKIRVYLIED